MHKSGFVNIIGRPNVGKSTLLNALIDDRLSIITHKPQTTRHRILAIYNTEAYQVVFSDSPGIIQDPAYEMQHSMNKFALSSFEDADLMLFMTDTTEKYEADDPLIDRLNKLQAPVFLVINKVDILKEEEIVAQIKWWNDRVIFKETVPISALKKFNTDRLMRLILDHIPEGPAYYPKDQITDRPERFFVSEIIREKILLLYQQEIPYSCEVEVESFKEDEDIIRIRALIFVNRKTQKAIIIGHKGQAIKRLGIKSRESLESFLGKKIYLELYVKVKEGWRDEEKSLKKFGYKDI